MYCAAVCIHKLLLLSTCLGVIFLIQFNNGLWASIGVTHSCLSRPFLCALALVMSYGLLSIMGRIPLMGKCNYVNTMYHMPVFIASVFHLQWY